MNPNEPETPPADLADILAQPALAGPLRDGAAMLVASAAPARIVFASRSAHAAFGTRDLAQLNAAAIAGASPGARRLRQLTDSVAGDTRPRLERLRFFVGRLPLQLTLLCAPVVDSRGAVFLVASPPRAGGAETPAAPPTAGAGAPAEAPALAPARDAAQARPAPAGRFLWGVDADLRFEAPAAALAAAVGETAPRAGEPLAALSGRTGLDPRGEWAAALASRATFAALRLAWPRGADAAVVLVSGAPLFDRERSFLGYRGFGFFTGETIAAEAPAAPNPASEAPAAAPTPAGTPGPASGDAPGPAIAAPGQAAAGGAPIATAGSERSAEIVPLRTPGPSFAGGPNVVPIRPGALRQLLATDDGARRGGDDESVELTTHERDAFREIARALGAKIKDHRETRVEAAEATAGEPPPAAQNPIGDAIDVGAAPAAERDESDLVDLLPIGALVARGGEALYCNRTLLDLLGYRDFAQFQTHAGFARMFDGRPPELTAPFGDGGALSLTLADGETIGVEAQIRIIAWRGAPATLISLRRSIAGEAAAAAMAALEREARALDGEARELSAVLDTATDGVVMWDGEGRIVSLNRPGEALFGVDQADVLGADFLTLFAPESHDSLRAYFEGLRTGGLASLLNDGREAVGRERHGGAIPLFITLGRISATPDAKFCAVLRDMTQWKTIERDLEHARGEAEKASALKSEFLAKISHEIRTPLNAILGFAEVIMDERFGPIGNERYKEYLKDIHASGVHVMSLINDLLDLSKIEAGKLDLAFAPVDANSVIQECVSLMQPQAAQERIIMRLSLFAKLPPIIADERSLRQIMLNLMSNAVKFNEPGGQVIVSTAMNETGQAVIRVRDTGIGMDEAEIDLALEPFRRLSTSRQTGGTGLGLPLTKALVEANRAGFSIKSRKEQGTLVEVAFPIAQPAAAQ
ncbi:MAG: PAS domain-containing sensor histidine kinase [Roseiarcus sp.]